MDDLEFGGLLDMYSAEELINELKKRDGVEALELGLRRGYNVLKEERERIVIIYRKPLVKIRKRHTR